MEDEIHFIFDEELERSRKELQEVISALEDDNGIKKKAETLKIFTRAVAFALKQPDPIKKEDLVKPNIQTRRMSILDRVFIQDNPPVVKKIPPKAIQEQPLILKQEVKPEIIQKDLIMDKITNKVLASVKLSDKYYLIEPRLDDLDTKVLNKILKKRPKNMDKGWKYIQKYGKKWKVTEDHFTNIKYYVVNFLFGLGRVEPLVYDKDIKEIYCEGPNKPIKLKYNNKIIETSILYPSKQELENFIYDLSYRVKRKIKKNNPTISFNYRELYIECTLSFSETSDSKFLIKK